GGAALGEDASSLDRVAVGPEVNRADGRALQARRAGEQQLIDRRRGGRDVVVLGIAVDGLAVAYGAVARQRRDEALAVAVTLPGGIARGRDVVEDDHVALERLERRHDGPQ